MKKFIKNNFSLLFKLLKKINNYYLRFSNWSDYIRLKYFFGVKKVGKPVSFSKGFKIFHGVHNIVIGNNVHLVDTLFNAGDNNGSIEFEDFVFFVHRVMLLARKHDY